MNRYMYDAVYTSCVHYILQLGLEIYLQLTLHLEQNKYSNLKTKMLTSCVLFAK